MSADTQALGEWVRMLRTARGLRQDELEQRAGLKRHTVGRIERAEVEVRVGVVFSLAEALDVTPADLFSYRPSGPTQQDLDRVLDRRPPATAD